LEKTEKNVPPFANAKGAKGSPPSSTYECATRHNFLGQAAGGLTFGCVIWFCGSAFAQAGVRHVSYSKTDEFMACAQSVLKRHIAIIIAAQKYAPQ